MDTYSFSKLYQNGHPKRVTIVMIAQERYSSFPKSLEELFRNTHYHFDVIVVEGNAPYSIRAALEKKTAQFKSVKLIYTNHCPTAAEAFNLAIPHIRTDYTFFTHNEMAFQEGWLTRLVQSADISDADIVFPSIITPYGWTSNGNGRNGYSGNGQTYSTRVEGMNGHNGNGTSTSSICAIGSKLPRISMDGFLIHRKALTVLGEFNEKIALPLLGLDLTMEAENRGFRVCIEPTVKIKRLSPVGLRPTDTRLFDRQWDLSAARQSTHIITQNRGIPIDEDMLINWIQCKRMSCAGAKPYFFGGVANLLYAPFRIAGKSVRRIFGLGGRSRIPSATSKKASHAT